ncbi:porin family protein [Proteiniphilum sp.]|uniref:porin family protein n=1 Tax=Proteiniphilum sp. TaxID=1926877 RepID=UPI002B2091AA|nr:porin family protein [Proteiniphilum sp.]MEA4916410.1 porin family protein [Proteiniphilum sp.]
MNSFLKFIGLFLLIFFAFLPLQAQKETSKSELYLGAGAGTLFSKMDFVPGVPQVYKQGIFSGISAKYISEKHLGLIVELNYVQRGWKEEFDSSTDFSYSRTLNYVDIPFMTHVYFGDKTRFVFNAGPQISLLLGDSQKMSQSLSDNLDERRANNPEARIGMQYEGMYDLSKIDYGLVGGIGMEIRTGIGDFDLEGRYYFGLGDIFTSRRSDKAYFSRSASRVIEAKLTYYIRIF